MCLVNYGLFQLFSFLFKKLTGLYPVGPSYDASCFCGSFGELIRCLALFFPRIDHCSGLLGSEDALGELAALLAELGEIVVEFGFLHLQLTSQAFVSGLELRWITS